MKKHHKKTVLAGVSIVVIGVVATTAAVYKCDIDRAYERLAEYETTAFEVEGATVEYRVDGEGPAVLVVHGNSGGHDQALQTGRSFFGEEHRIVAVSRFGYLGSQIPEDSSPAAQARVYEAVLERERIDEAIVIGVSAGGAPALRFALDYPARASGLVLVAVDVPSKSADRPTGPPHALLHDLPFWLITRPFRAAMFAMFGLDRASFRSAPPAARESVEELFETLLPLEPRRAGMINDERVTMPEMAGNYDEYPLEELRVPALVFQAKNDPLASYERVAAAAARIPDCRFVSFDTGGHLLFGHDEEIDEEIGRFVDRVSG